MNRKASVVAHFQRRYALSGNPDGNLVYVPDEPLFHKVSHVRLLLLYPPRAGFTGRLRASLSTGILEKLTNVVEITLSATLLVPQPYRFPDTLQAEDKFWEGELAARPSICG